MKEILYYQLLETAKIYLFATEQGLAFVGSENSELEEVLNWYPNATLLPNQELLAPYTKAFDCFFSGQTTTFDLPIETPGTAFQKKVWQALTDIPYGQTRTYSDIAEGIGAPKAIRAVASAIAKNPLLILIPCHRVIGKDGALRGYRGGLDMKVKLLDFEQKQEHLS